MDKFELEQFTTLRDLISDLQSCFIDEDAYSRTPDFLQWRQASKLVHRISLVFRETFGYMNACRLYSFNEGRANFCLIEAEKQPLPSEAGAPSIIGENGFLEFTKQEILKMPKQFRKQFRTHGLTAYVRVTKDNLYQIRCRAKGFHIQATSKHLEEAKEKFIVALYEQAENYSEYSDFRKVKAKKVLLRTFASDWLENVKRLYIKDGTYADYKRSLDLQIFPSLGDREIKSIKPMDVQLFINALGSSRTCEKAYKILKAIFAYAVASGIIARSPMELVKQPYYEQKQSTALTIEEERELIAALEGSPYKYVFICILYLGLRRSELKTAVFDENFVTVISAKQRKGRTEVTRKIPITPMLRKYMPNMPIGELPTVRDDTLSAVFKKICPAHHLHELRHTFITRCQECGVPREVVSVWAGHKADNTMTSNVYTHFSDEYMLSESKKVLY